MKKQPVIALTAGMLTSKNNLIQINLYSNYAESLTDQGALAIPIADVRPEVVKHYCASADGLMLTGGLDVSPDEYGEPCLPVCAKVNPRRDALERAYVLAFLQAGKPILGICRGMQMLNVVLGGTLWQDVPTQLDLPHERGADHPVQNVEGSPIAGLFGPKMTVNSFHHQAIKDLAPCLIPCSYSENGRIVEAFYHETLPILAVQWHPERMRGADRLTREGPDMSPLFHWFVEKCR